MAKKKIYLIAASHLDTVWEWSLETTVEKFLPATFEDNFKLLDRYPTYVFGWEGAYRYALLEEYYPDLFACLGDYVAEGRWVPTGAAWENGDVNQPSPEAIFRNILYGQDYFKKKFGVVSNDVFLPDCFGFGYALPTVARHAGLIGFTTQKLSYGGAYDRPFDIGKWYGVDGSFVYASLGAGSYASRVEKEGPLGENARLGEKLKDNAKSGMDYTNTFFGTGDKGGAPNGRTVRFVDRAVRGGGETAARCVTTREFFAEVAASDGEGKIAFPEWRGELPLRTHGVGSYTSRTCSSRWNKAAERLGDAAERACVLAGTLGASYPSGRFDYAWKRVCEHQFHDDLTGTSLALCYKRSWNDYMTAQKIFAEETRAAIETCAAALDGSFTRGFACAVFNPVASADGREGVCRLELPAGVENARVFDRDGAELPSQCAAIDGRRLLSFKCAAPSCGVALYDIRPCAAEPAPESDPRVLENEFLRVTVDENGDICSVYDKESGREALAAPVRDEVYAYDGNRDYPAWEMTYDEMNAPPRERARAVAIKPVEDGPVRRAIRVRKKLGRGTLTQMISLDAGARFVYVENELDWRDERSLYKVRFETAARADGAAYDLGLGVIERPRSSPKTFEYPAQTWADLTDASGGFGVSFFSDSRTGWDNPAGNCLRLTVVHTPKYPKNPGQAQNLLDLGLNRFGYAIMPHAGGWRERTQSTAAEFSAPLRAFLLTAAPRGTEKGLSLLRISDGGVTVRAVKKSQNGDGIVVRVSEDQGAPHAGVRISLRGGVASASEAYATEQPVAPARVEEGELVFDLPPFAPGTFILTPRAVSPEAKRGDVNLILPFDTRAITRDPAERSDLAVTVPSVLIGDAVEAGGVRFFVGGDGQNAVRAAGQKLDLPRGTAALHLLAAAVGGRREAVFGLGGVPASAEICGLEEPLGSWDLVCRAETGHVGGGVPAFCATHAHGGGRVIPCKTLNLYKITLPVPDGARTLTLPRDPEVLIFAAVASPSPIIARDGITPVDRLEPRECDYTVSIHAFRALRPGVTPEPRFVRREGRRKYVDVRALLPDLEKYDHPRDGFDD